jgi:hypothetical protein
MELAEHKEFSEDRIKEIKDAIKEIPELIKNKLCIFVTGSYINDQLHAVFCYA